MAGTVFDPPVAGWERRVPSDKQFFLWVLLLQAILMIGLSGAWIFAGPQNNPTKRFRASPEEFAQRVNEFVEKYSPDIIAVELDRNRFLTLMYESTGKKAKKRYFSIIINNGFWLCVNQSFLYLWNYLYVYWECFVLILYLWDYHSDLWFFPVERKVQQI